MKFKNKVRALSLDWDVTSFQFLEIAGKFDEIGEACNWDETNEAFIAVSKEYWNIWKKNNTAYQKYKQLKNRK